MKDLIEPARDPLGRLSARRTTRATFLKGGAGGLLTVASGAALARTLSPSTAQASASTFEFSLSMTDGFVHMADGSPCWARGFTINNGDGSPVMVPGPMIGRQPVPRLSEPGEAERLASHDFSCDKQLTTFGEVPFVLEGDTVVLTIKNSFDRPHDFTFVPPVEFTKVDDVAVEPAPTVVTIGAGQELRLEFVAPAAGTYIYMIDDEIQRLLGLHGVMVVMPGDGSRRPYTPSANILAAPEFDKQFVWVFHDVDPVWGNIAHLTPEKIPRLDQPEEYEAFRRTLLPRYFTINGLSGEDSSENPSTSRRNRAGQCVVPDGVRGKGTLIRIVNVGGAVHSPHFHGNHVYILTDNGQPFGRGPAGEPLAVEKDVFPMQPLGRKDVLLPFHEPLDQWPPYERNGTHDLHYPMHCHAEMSQTAGGGQYPNGMYTEWSLNGPLGPPAHVGG